MTTTSPEPSAAVPPAPPVASAVPPGSPRAGRDRLRAEIVGLRPRDHVEADRLAATIAERMFGVSTDPLRIDRFIIVSRLGTGGMGVVYSAYDPLLDRKVALKLLRDSSRVGPVEHERLLREAHALARITHPNVVTVHEVGQLGSQVFVVMELLVGHTLDAWARAGKHDWRQVLEVYLQAGRGLAAAHAAGLVHRDFKPQNAIIGDDGRVRVVDFGLARGEGSLLAAAEEEAVTDATEAVDPASSSPAASCGAGVADRFDALLTRPNCLLGTPAYMSPEQYSQRPAGPASDQFSFCVALYEALVGTRPFTADTPQELARKILEGTMRELPRRTRVPAWVVATLRRGMSVQARDRFGSMNELLAALCRDPARTRRRWLLGTAFTALAGISMEALLLPTPAEDPCRSSSLALAEVWSPERRAELHDHLTSLPTAAAAVVSSRILDTVDGYAERWQQMHEAACLAHHRGEQSDALLDKRMACLARRRAALDSAAQVLGTADVEAFERAAFMVNELPPVHACGDLDVLEAEIPVPEDLADALAVAQAREGLAQATTLVTAGRLAAAREQAAHWERQATEVGHEPLIAEALLVRGRIEMEHDPVDGSRPSQTLHEAFLAGIATRNETVAAEALARRLYVDTIRPGGREWDAEDYALIRSLLQRVPAASGVEGLFLNNASSVAAARGDYEAARTYAEQALEVKRSAPEPNRIALLETRFNLALYAADADAQLAGLEAVAAEAEDELGSTHPFTFEVEMALARSLKDPLLAWQRFADLCETYERNRPERIASIAECLYDQAVGLADTHHLEQAGDTFERVASMLHAPHMPPPLHVWYSRARGNALLCRGKPLQAVAELQATVSTLVGAEQPQWMETSIAELHATLGRALWAAGRPAEAMPLLTTAIEVLARAAAKRVVPAVERTLAQARLTLARARVDAPGSIVPPSSAASASAETTALLDAAESWYRAAGPGNAWRLAEIQAVRTKVPVK